MDPNEKFKKKDVISVANLPARFQIRDPEEYRMEAMDILIEMGFCPSCRDHLPCYCPNMPKEQTITIGRKGCINCGSPMTKLGGFCSTKCQAVYAGEA